MSNLFLDIHVLQTVPPSNINRDDTGSPKTAVYGGVRRARVSSQAWKRAVRTDFNRNLDLADVGVRTKRLVELVAKRILETTSDISDTDAESLAEAALTAGGVKVAPPKKKAKEGKDGAETEPEAGQSGYLLFISNRQVDQLAELAVAHRDDLKIDKKAAKAALNTQHSVDVSLFGRMVADSADLNVDASTQVAHAISVHSVETEFDYFTAVDDKRKDDESGAGMIGTIEFNSSTLYRYATMNLRQLGNNLGNADAVVKAANAFTRSFIESMPTGKQNTFANRTLPDAVVVTLRDRQPVNLVGAFEDPVVADGQSGRLAGAATRLTEHSRDLDEAYSQQPVATWVISASKATRALEQLGTKVTVDSLISGIESEVGARLREQS